MTPAYGLANRLLDAVMLLVPPAEREAEKAALGNGRGRHQMSGAPSVLRAKAAALVTCATAMRFRTARFVICRPPRRRPRLLRVSRKRLFRPW
jgi:hypothetical protein